jgi:2-keto-4-pentenoate hydratase
VSPEEDVARRMLADYDARRPNALFAERGTQWLTLAEAYGVQRAVAGLRAARGERRIGYKVGCVGRSIRRQLGLAQPVYGLVWESEVHASGCRLDPARFANLAVEGEIALCLGRDVPPEVTGAAELAGCVEHWFPALELHHYVFRGPQKTSQELVAGNAMHAGLVLSSPLVGLPVAELERAEVRMEIDGQRAASHRATVLPGGPLGSLRWLAAALARDGERPRAGEIVLTGAPGRLIRARPGIAVAVTSGGVRVELFVVPTTAP